MDHEGICIPTFKYNVGLCWCHMEELILLIDDEPVDEEKLKEIRKRIRLKQKELRKRIEYHRNHPDERVPDSGEAGQAEQKARTGQM